MCAAPNLVIVLDGLTVPDQVTTGCRHDPPWYVRQLGAGILSAFADRPDWPLDDLLSDGIGRVARLHADTCDLANPATPSSTVALLRERASAIDYLVLADAFAVLDLVHEAPRVVTDHRVDDVATREAAAVYAAAGGRDHDRRVLSLVTEQLRWRNQADGYWIAGSQPDAAAHAVTGTIASRDLRRAVLLTDGAARLVDPFRMTDWRGLLDLAETRGPDEVIRLVRTAELGDNAAARWPRFKASDDATVAIALPS